MQSRSPIVRYEIISPSPYKLINEIADAGRPRSGTTRAHRAIRYLHTLRRLSGQTTERFTVDLTPDLNDALARWATQRKRSVGRRVPKPEVARVLIELLLKDASLSTQVEERLKRQP